MAETLIRRSFLGKLRKLFMINLGLGLVFLAFVCLVSWVSECHLMPEVYGKDRQNPWVLMDPPIMSLYLSVPGFFTNLISALVCFIHAE